jgi:hypothetical protein
MKKRFISIPVLALLILAVAIATAYAAPTAQHATLYTTDINGNPKIQFNLGETVYIHWAADGTVDITVNYQDATNDGSWTDQLATGVIPYVPSLGAGSYLISCTGASIILIAYGTIFVVPEVPIGIIVALAGFFGAFGTFKLRRKE